MIFMGEPESVTKIFKIHEGRLEWFKAKMEKLTRRAAKIGVPAPTYTLGAVELVKETHREEVGEDVSGRPVYTEYDVVTRYYPATISGDAPKYAGWTFAATIEILEGGENLVRSFGETALPVRFRATETASDCEHCNVSRRRNETFVLLRDNGDYKQVGRQCLRDFLGHKDPEALARAAEYLSEAFGLGEGAGQGGPGQALAIDYFLNFVAAAMNAFGWCSRTKAKENGHSATANEALRHAAPSKEDLKNPKFKRLDITEDDKKRAEIALEWVLELSDDEVLASDYLHNIRTIARAGVIEYRTAGYAASIIIACEKAQERVRAAKERPVSNFVGTIGARELFTVTLNKILELENEFGVSYLHMMTDAVGNDLKWFGSKRLYFWEKRVNEGDTVTIKATVKSHEEYKGRKQTLLSRATVYIECPKNTKKNVKIGQAIVDAFLVLNDGCQ